jgi:hypothetical protein
MSRHDYILYEVVGGTEIVVNGLSTTLLVKKYVGKLARKQIDP